MAYDSDDEEGDAIQIDYEEEDPYADLYVDPPASSAAAPVPPPKASTSSAFERDPPPHLRDGDGDITLSVAGPVEDDLNAGFHLPLPLPLEQELAVASEAGKSPLFVGRSRSKSRHQPRDPWSSRHRASPQQEDYEPAEGQLEQEPLSPPPEPEEELDWEHPDYKPPVSVPVTNPYNIFPKGTKGKEREKDYYALPSHEKWDSRSGRSGGARSSRASSLSEDRGRSRRRPRHTSRDWLDGSPEGDEETRSFPGSASEVVETDLERGRGRKPRAWAEEDEMPPHPWVVAYQQSRAITDRVGWKGDKVPSDEEEENDLVSRLRRSLSVSTGHGSTQWREKSSERGTPFLEPAKIKEHKSIKSRGKRTRRAAELETEPGDTGAYEDQEHYAQDQGPSAWIRKHDQEPQHTFMDLAPHLEVVVDERRTIKRRRYTEEPPKLSAGMFLPVDDDSINALLTGRRMEFDYTAALPLLPPANGEESEGDKQRRALREKRDRSRSRSKNGSRGGRSGSSSGRSSPEAQSWVGEVHERYGKVERISAASLKDGATSIGDAKDDDSSDSAETRHSQALSIVKKRPGVTHVIGTRQRFKLELVMAAPDGFAAADDIGLLHHSRLPTYRPSYLYFGALKTKNITKLRPFAISMGVEYNKSFRFAQANSNDVPLMSALPGHLLPSGVHATTLYSLQNALVPVIVVFCKSDMPEEDATMIQSLIERGGIASDQYSYLPDTLVSYLKSEMGGFRTLLFHPVTNGRCPSPWKLPTLKPPETYLVRLMEYFPAEYDLPTELLLEHIQELEDDDGNNCVWDEPNNLLLTEIELKPISKQLESSRGLWLLHGHTPTPIQVTGYKKHWTFEAPDGEEDFELGEEFTLWFEIHLSREPCDLLGCDMPFSHPTHLHDQFEQRAKAKYRERFE